MKNAAFLVLCSGYYEGCPMTLLQAFATGLPVIVTGHGSLGELVDDGRTGRHFTPGSNLDLCRKWTGRGRTLKSGPSSDVRRVSNSSASHVPSETMCRCWTSTVGRSVRAPAMDITDDARFDSGAHPDSLLPLIRQPGRAGTEFCVRPGVLARQLQFLQRQGYRSMTLNEVVEAFEAGTPLEKVVVLTFDDGYRDNVTTAAPLLRAHGFRATLFVVNELVGRSNTIFSGETTPSCGRDPVAP